MSNNKSSSAFYGFIGPLMPLPVLKKIEQLHEKALQALLMDVAKPQFVIGDALKASYDKVLKAAYLTEAARDQRRLAEFKISLYENHFNTVKFRNENKISSLPTIQSLPPIEIYGQPSKFSVIGEVDISPNDQFYFCECGAWVHPDFSHICIEFGGPVRSNKRIKKDDKYLKSFCFKFQGEWRVRPDFERRACHVPLPKPERDERLLIKMRNIVFLHSLYRKVKQLRISRFRLDSSISQFLDAPKTINSVYLAYHLFNIQQEERSVKEYVDFNTIDWDNMIADDCLKLGEVDFIEEPEQILLELAKHHPTYQPALTKIIRVEAQVGDEATPHGACDDLKQEQQSNVVLTTHAEESKAEPITISMDNWEKLCSPQNVQEYTQLMSRWQQFKQVYWSPDNISGTELLDIPLFKEFVTSLKDSPNCLMFKQYAFFRSDIEVKIVVNTNKFHCGTLQASFYYGADLDEHYKDRKNIYCASQMSHCLIDAASATDGMLVIPYRHYKPLMGTFNRSDDQDVLNMGHLRLYVLNQLKVPKGDTNKIDVNIFMRFVNPSFHGMKPNTKGLLTAEAQMMSTSSLKAVVNTTANLVNQIFPDEQRDNPSDIIPPKPMVPWSAHSWCVGDVLPEPINPLRLQASGSTPHPPGTLPEEPEMRIDYINSVFGLCSISDWSKDNAKGTILKIMPFSPVWQWDDYPSVVVDNGEQRYCKVLPPVSVMSELFAYWRGSLEYRIDFVATQFHTGRLIIAYVPRLSSDPNISIAELTSCDHIIVDLREERQVNYINSYLSDKPWWPRRKTARNTTETSPPGYIYIAVLNQLTATAAVSPSIQFNIYMRAGRDFELHVPVNPQIGLSYNTKMVNTEIASISYLSNYGPPYTSMYAGKWHVTGSGLVLRYGPTSDHVTQFKLSDCVGKRVFKLSYPLKYAIPHPKYKSGVNFLVLFTTTNHSYAYGALFDNYARALRFAETLTQDGVLTDESLAAMLPSGDVAGDYVPQDVTYYWKVTTSNIEEDFEIVSQAGDERKVACGEDVQVQKSVNSTWNGLLTFGEQITNLKQLTRRYAPYCQFVSETKGASDPSIADFAIPLLPQGLNISPIVAATGKENKYANRIRDGPISIIASGYRFYRGSMRLRLVVTGKEEGVFWVQHRPEYSVRSLDVFKPDSSYVDALYQPGYASLIQLTEMNNVIEVEVPYYLPGQFGLLQRPNLQRVEDAVHYTMGTLYCGFDTMKGVPAEVPYFVQGFYSMGDDMTFSVFQGYPPMLDLSIYNAPLQVYAQGPIDYVTSKITGYVTEQVKEKICETVSEPLKVSLDNAAVAETDIISLVKQYTVDLDTQKQQLIISIVSQLVHSMINPTVSQVAWSIASIFCHMGVVAVGFLDKFMIAIKALINRFDFLTSRAKKSDQAANTVVAQSDDPSDGSGTQVEAAFVSTCVTGMLAMVGAVNKPLPQTLPNFATYLYDGLPKFSMTANGLFTFLKNNLLMFKKMWYWLVAYFNEDYIIYKELHGATDKVLNFIKKVQWCLDSRNKDQVKTDPLATVQVYELANIASSYLAKRATSTITKPMPLFDGYCKKIIALRDELTELMLSPAVRFEPFVIGINGPSNLGKSHLANKLARELLASIDYKSYSEVTYVRTPGNAYWNGLRNQPVCIFDDFLNLTASEHALVQIGELFQLKSKAVFNPPMAAIEEKKIRYNPLIVILCSNNAFPDIDGVALQEAWMRRRDVLYEVSKHKDYVGTHPRCMPKEVKESYGHLEFKQYKNPAESASKPASKHFIKGDETCKFDEMLPDLIKRFHVYFNEECEQYNAAIQEVRQFYPDAAVGTDEYVKSIHERIDQVNSHPSRIPKAEIKIIQDQLIELQQHKYSADMTKFTKKRIVEKKMQDLEQEQQQVATTSAVSAQAQAGEGFVSMKAALSTLVDHDPRFANEKEKLSQMFISFDTMGIKQLCPCGFYAGLCDRFEADTSNTGKSYLKGCFRMGSIGGSSISLAIEPCTILPDKRCMLIQKKFWLFMFENRMNVFKQANSIFWPKLMQEIKEERLVSKDPVDKINLLSTSEIDSVLREEIADEAWYEKLWNGIPGWGTILKWIVKLGAIFAAIGGLIRLAGYFIASPDEAEATVREASNHNLRSKGEQLYTQLQCARVAQEANDFLGDDELEAQNYKVGTVAIKLHPNINPKVFANATNQEEVISAKIIRNTFFLYAEYGDETRMTSRVFRCLGLNRHNFIIIDHYVTFLRQQPNLKLSFVRDGCCVEISTAFLSECKAIKDSALMVAEMDKTVPQFVNIIKFFIRSNQTGNLSPLATLHEYVWDANKQNYSLRSRDFSRISRQNCVSVTNDDDSRTIVSCLYEYPYGGKGVCGSVLVSRQPLTNPILGIHIAGFSDGSRGYSEAIVYETFEHLLKEEAPQIISNSAAAVYVDEKPIMKLEGNVLQVGVIPRNEAIYPPDKSRLMYTECAGEFGPITYDYPVLSSKDPRIAGAPFSPLLEGCAHHANPCLPFDESYVVRAVEDLRNLVLAYAKPLRLDVGKLSYEEAICGLPYHTAYDAMAMDTSEGYPWIKNRPQGCSNKSWMFDRELTESGWKLNGMYEPLLEAMERKDAQRRLGYYEETVFTDCLKDAKLPKEKVLQPGKTRIFSISPVDFTIQHRQYAQDFVAAYMAARFDCEHAVGIDIYGLETTELIHRMSSFSNKFITADYSKFGDQLNARLVQAVYDIIADWYELNGCKDPKFRLVLKCFSMEVSYATHLMLNQLYRCFGGMPSGNPLTVIINSMVNSMYVRIVWQEIMVNVSLSLIDMSSFRRNVMQISYGDDLFLAVKDEVIDDFNAVTMSDAFAKHGIKFTNSTKSGDMVPYTKLMDPATTFLKCTFHPHPTRSNLWVARMEERVIRECSNWTWNTSRDLQANSVTACEAMMELCYGYGPEYYEDLRRRVTLYWLKKGVFFNCPDWLAIDIRIYGLE
nr:polyprotein [Hypera postica associated iflavirus 1]